MVVPHSGFSIRNGSFRAGLAFLLSAAGTGWAASATIPASATVPLTIEQITSRMIQVDAQKHANLPDFSVTRKYVLRNSRMKRDAEMLVRVTYRKGEGKSFQVLQAEGVEGMSKRVFQHLMDAEKEAGRRDNQNRGRMNSQNYSFELLGTESVDGRRCYVLGLTPKTKIKYLFNGKVWVDATDFAVAKLEGHPAANISFWVGKPLIMQTWQKTGEFWMAAKNRSRSESRLLGSSELTVDNTSYDFGTLLAERPTKQVSSAQ